MPTAPTILTDCSCLLANNSNLGYQFQKWHNLEVSFSEQYGEITCFKCQVYFSCYALTSLKEYIEIIYHGLKGSCMESCHFIFTFEVLISFVIVSEAINNYDLSLFCSLFLIVLVISDIMALVS